MQQSCRILWSMAYHIYYFRSILATHLYYSILVLQTSTCQHALIISRKLTLKITTSLVLLLILLPRNTSWPMCMWIHLLLSLSFKRNFGVSNWECYSCSTWATFVLILSTYLYVGKKRIWWLWYLCLMYICHSSYLYFAVSWFVAM